MTKLKYEKKSLFDTPEMSYLVHACNAQGVWGSGIATAFKSKFPGAYNVYRRFCAKEQNNLGKALQICDNDYIIVCLIVSEGFGAEKSPKYEILANTETALHNLLKTMQPGEVVHSNKFNSGFFGIPWPETEKILIDVLNQYDVQWVVCDPDLT